MMQTSRMWIVFIYLSGTILSGQSLNFLHDMDEYFKAFYTTPELEPAAVHPSGIATEPTLDPHVSSAPVPDGKIYTYSMVSCFFLCLLALI